MRRVGWAALLAAALIATPAAAQFGPSAIGPESTLLEELIVVGHRGPPWWRVSDGDSTVYILADPGAPPPSLTIDRTLIRERLRGANALILSPRFSGKGWAPLGAPGHRAMKAMRGDQGGDLERELPPDLRARFVAARTAIGQPPERYAALPPGAAGMALAYDADRAAEAGIASGDVPFWRLVWADAKAAKVRRIEPAKAYQAKDIAGLLEDAFRTGPPCLAAALETLQDRQPTPPPAAVSAWAAGDIRPLIDHYRRTGRRVWVSVGRTTPRGPVGFRMSAPACAGAMPYLARLSADWIPVQVAAVDRALAQPGHAVAVFDPGALLVAGGVLDQLRRRGYQVTGPDDPQ